MALNYYNMKTIFKPFYKKLLFFLLLIAVLIQVGCKKEHSGAPAITNLRAMAPSPNDSTLTVAGPGQWVVIRGANLRGASAIYFNGWPASFNSALFSDTTLVVLIPADMPFATLDQNKLNTVTVTTPAGEATYKFPIVPPPPVIMAMSNENAVAGTVVVIYGNNFFFVDKVIFPGGIAVSTGISSNQSGTALQLTVPPGITAGGPIQVQNRYGTGTSILLFNDMVTGVLHNYDNVNNFDWGAGTSASSSAYPGNRGTYGVMNASGVAGGDFGWWNGNRSINTKSVVWIPVAQLTSNTLDDFALKFEVNVKTPWNAGSIYVVRDYDWTYVARFEPWLKSDGSASSVATNGWETAIIPLSMFKTKSGSLDGTGNPAPSLTALLSNTGAGPIDFMFVNSGTAPASFEAAIDNIRVVRIK
jgi:hypothetical protein